MNKKTVGMLVSVFLTASLIIVAKATADNAGAPGSVASLLMRATASSDYSKFHGAVYLKTDQGIDEYKWGGSTCPGKDIVNFNQNRVIMDALIQYSQDEKMIVVPIFKNGQGGAKCLVGITGSNSDIPIIQ